MDNIVLLEFLLFVAFLPLIAGAGRWCGVWHGSASQGSFPLQILAVRGGVANSLIFVDSSGSGVFVLSWRPLARDGIPAICSKLAPEAKRLVLATCRVSMQCRPIVFGNLLCGRVLIHHPSIISADFHLAIR